MRLSETSVVRVCGINGMHSAPDTLNERLLDDMVETRGKSVRLPKALRIEQGVEGPGRMLFCLGVVDWANLKVHVWVWFPVVSFLCV